MSLAVRAPLAGRVLPLADVPDPVFAGQIVGAGLAIEPADGATGVVVTSPVAGRVAKVHPHAFVVALEGTTTGVLVHLGIDTVGLKGRASPSTSPTGTSWRPVMRSSPSTRPGSEPPACPRCARSW